MVFVVTLSWVSCGLVCILAFLICFDYFGILVFWFGSVLWFVCVCVFLCCLFFVLSWLFGLWICVSCGLAWRRFLQSAFVLW